MWLAHTNIFNLLAGIACAFTVCLGFQHRLAGNVTLAAWALAGGASVLIYPLFIVLLPAFLAGIVLGALFNSKSRQAVGQRPTWKSWLDLAVIAALFVVPVLAWNLVVTFVFATATYFTAQKAQFTWLLTAYQEGVLISALHANWNLFAGRLQANFSWIEVLLPVAGIGAVLARGGVKNLRLFDPVMVALTVALFGILLFNYLQGYYAARMHVAVIALVFIFLARLAQIVRQEQLASVFLVAVAAAQLADAASNPAASGV